MNLPVSMGDGMMNRLSGNNVEDSLQSELELMLLQRHNRSVIDRERELNMYRSGSAPPTVEGSLNAVGSILRNSNFVQIDQSRISNGGNIGVLTEEELRSHPDYLRYYYSLENLNPRLPPPLLSKEDWRIAQRFQGGGSSFGASGDWRGNHLVNDRGGSSLFSMQPGLAVQKAAEDELMELRKAITARSISRNSSTERLDRISDGLVGRPGAGMGVRRKSFADILQEGLDRSASSSGRMSRSTSRSSLGDAMDTKVISYSHAAELGNRKESSEALHTGAAAADLSRFQNLGSAVPESAASAVSSSRSRSRTPEPHLVGVSPSPGIPLVSGRGFPAENKKIFGMNALNSLSMSELADVAASLSGLSLSRSRLRDEDNLLQSQIQMRFDKQNNYLAQVSNSQRQSLQQQFIDSLIAEKLGINSNNVDFVRENGSVTDLNVSKQGMDEQANFSRTSSFADLRSNLNNFDFASLEGSKIHYQADNSPAVDFSGHISNGYSPEKLKIAVNNHLPTATASSTAGNGQNLRRSNEQAAFDLHMPAVDPHYIQYMLKTSDYATHAAASSGDLSQGRNDYGISHGHGDLRGLQKAYIEALLAQQKQQYESSLFGKSDSSNHQYVGNPAFDLGMSYQGNPVANSVLPSFGSQPLSQNERTTHIASTPKSSVGGSTGSSSVDGRVPSSLLEELKNSKTKSFELSDVVDHVIEFSMDQYGSRFIQQKLETATVEEKKTIFREIFPRVRGLMTDVFGNYVIQKFFEHGTESQRKELASQLIGHVLPLSLQMYGCRVIQKALEVVDLHLQTQMVAELDGSVMKCVRDQNGNHVIQKCIECVPQDRIHFIVSSFFGQVVSLSSHPYGCRVIQRVLEHCDDPNTQQVVMEEIMNSVCTLAQDQYGNYVIQHVLQHGKPHERSAVISKLAGQIIKMSQQKFASNVVEKCLTFGGPEERQLLVNEMLGSTDENEPLQAMMKDPFGNYVVQKVLETCDDKSRELILSRIKVHLAALKRYTYGKHIVSRVEKLITSGERRIALSSSHSS